MRERLLHRDVWPVLFWVGLAWVYSGAFWLLGLLTAAQSGWPAGTLALAMRLGGTLAIGVGLCAVERWAWAPALCLTGFYACVGLVVAGITAWAALFPPAGTLSWTPVLWGMPVDQCVRVCVLCAALFLLCAAVAGVLWHGRSQYEVPYRRAFTVLVRKGLVPTLGLLLLDGFLVASLWTGWTR
jgi:hypothetical protein